MLRNYLTVAFRTLRRQKAVSVVTIGSLAVGLACCLLLFLYVRHEWTYDRFHEDADRIFRVVNEQVQPSGTPAPTATLPISVGPTLAESLPAVKASVRFSKRNVALTPSGGPTFEDVSVTLVDSSVFDVFSGFVLRGGSEQAALAGPGSAVLSEGAAQRYFGDANPLGKRLTVEFGHGTLEATITGVAGALAGPSSIPFEVVLPFDNIEKDFEAQSWKLIGDRLPLARTYVRLSSGADANDATEYVAELMAERAEGEKKLYSFGSNESTGFRLQPLTEVHLSPEIKGGLVPPGNPVYSYTLAGIALLILLLACINFMALSLARSAGRGLEVGIRKAVGAQREQVAGQFWGEALLTTTFALVLGTMLARLALPVFNRLTEQELSLNLLGSPSLWLALVSMVLVIALVAGGYPALALSGLAPTEVMRGGPARLGGRSRFTRGLVALQFSFAIALVAGVLIMSSQLRYVTEAGANFDADQIVRVNTSRANTEVAREGDGPSFYDRFRSEVLRQSGVKAVAGSFGTFPGGGGVENNLQLGDTASVRVHYSGVSDNFLDMMQVKLVAGRRFEEGASQGAAQPALVNRALVRAMGWASPEAALGKKVPLDLRLSTGGTEYTEVIGVVEDFHYQSLREQIKPLALVPLEDMPAMLRMAYVRFRPGQTAAVLASLEETWRQAAPADVPFEYEFLDDIVRQQYEEERRWQTLVRYAAVLALVISCAGLFGLALLSVKRREKEIGIRKVLGASAWNVTLLVTRQFALLVAIGFVLAVPLAWLGARRWLEGFAYRIELGTGPFVIAGVAVLTVAMVTVSYQALRAARTDPAQALRDE